MSPGERERERVREREREREREKEIVLIIHKKSVINLTGIFPTALAHTHTCNHEPNTKAEKK